jgi:hypothetical protein
VEAVVYMVEALYDEPEGRGFDEFTGFQPHYDPGVDSASNSQINEIFGSVQNIRQ